MKNSLLKTLLLVLLILIVPIFVFANGNKENDQSANIDICSTEKDFEGHKMFAETIENVKKNGMRISIKQITEIDNVVSGSITKATVKMTQQNSMIAWVTINNSEIVYTQVYDPKNKYYFYAKELKGNIVIIYTKDNSNWHRVKSENIDSILGYMMYLFSQQLPKNDIVMAIKNIKILTKNKEN